jgi:hypothetical protein
MPTLGKLIADIRHRLTGVGSYLGNSAELIEDLNEDSLLIRIDDAAKHSPGVYEIGLEKIRIRSVDAGSGTMRAFTFGRGYDGTTINFHTMGSEITRCGPFPSATVAQEINNVLTQFWPTLYGVVVYDVEYAAPFVMPDDCAGIIGVFISDQTAVDGWRRTDRYVWEPGSGQGLKIFEARRGEGVRIQYAVQPKIFDLSDVDVINFDWSLTGLPDRMANLLTLGVAYRLSPFADVGNLFNVGQEARADTTKPPQRGATISRLLQQQYELALMNEQQALHKAAPIRVHKER